MSWVFALLARAVPIPNNCTQGQAMPRNHMKLIVATMAILLAGTAGAAEKHRHSFARDVDALHEVLGPLWHAPKGKERAENVCAQASKLESLSREIHSGDSGALLASIADLKVQCKSDPSDIDAAFSRVHDAFHHLAEH